MLPTKLERELKSIKCDIKEWLDPHTHIAEMLSQRIEKLIIEAYQCMPNPIVHEVKKYYDEES